MTSAADPVGASLVDARAAARIVSDRPELWFPGAMAWVVTVGWLPFLAAVVQPPSEGDLAFLGAGLLTSAAWPFNALALIAAAALVVAAALASLAVAEVALWAFQRHAGRGIAGIGGGAARLLGIELIASLPVLVASIVSGVALLAILPGEFQSPDIDGPLAVRVLAAAAPYLVLVGLSILAAQAVGSVAGRRALLAGRPPTAALAESISHVGRRPAAVVTVALLSAAVSAAYATVAWLLLRILWAPIATQLGGVGIDAGAALLLLGFVAIWLCLVLGGGAVHAWASTWWTFEVAAGALDPVAPVRAWTEGGPA